MLATLAAAWGLTAGCETETGGDVGTVVFAAGGSGALDSAANDSGMKPDVSAGGSGGGAGQAGGQAGAGQAANAGQAGAGAVAGISGMAGAGGRKLCAEACSREQDCGNALSNQPFSCNRATSRCEGFAQPCKNETECIPGASQWFWNCSSDQDCYFFDGDVCLRVAGLGKCARPAPQTDAAGGGCVFPVPNAIQLPRFDGSGTVLVCADTSQKCHIGSCILACKTSQQCTPDRNGSICNQQTGSCECVADRDCGGPGVSRCNTTTRRCECASDIDCDNLPNADTCVAGQCGCSSASACKTERIFSGTRIVCE